MSEERMQPYTVTELAEAAGVSVAYIRRLVSDGRIAGQKVGPLWVIPVDEGKRFLRERQAKN